MNIEKLSVLPNRLPQNSKLTPNNNNNQKTTILMNICENRKLLVHTVLIWMISRRRSPLGACGNHLVAAVAGPSVRAGVILNEPIVQIVGVHETGTRAERKKQTVLHAGHVSLAAIDLQTGGLLDGAFPRHPNWQLFFAGLGGGVSADAFRKNVFHVRDVAGLLGEGRGAAGGIADGLSGERHGDLTKRYLNFTLRVGVG